MKFNMLSYLEYLLYLPAINNGSWLKLIGSQSQGLLSCLGGQLYDLKQTVSDHIIFKNRFLIIKKKIIFQTLVHLNKQ